jgi:hypothetical protein
MDTLDERQRIVFQWRCHAGSVSTETECEGLDVGSDPSLRCEGICGHHWGLELTQASDDGSGRLAMSSPENDGWKKALMGPLAVPEPPGDECGGAEGVLALGLVWDTGNVVDDEVLELLGEPFEACGGFDAVHGWERLDILRGLSYRDL